jgi:hypothetical protein
MKNKRQSKGAELLRAYLKRENISISNFCVFHGFNRHTATKWLSGGTPKLAAAAKIEDITRQSVPMRSWLLGG